ncbi:MAG: putative glycosyltransferase [Parcubacteria group bacterium GW2011_GWD2_38_11]|nr:MAG: putative glycosyltransferase [Parcubacteria group bacterium GW2011_GWD2_38_11]
MNAECYMLYAKCFMDIGIDIRLIGKKRTGDEVVVFNLVKSFAQIGTDHRFKLFTDIADAVMLKEISEQLGIAGKDNFEIISLSTKNKFVWNFWTLPQYLKKNPVDVYHTQYITPFFVSRKVKIVTIVHDISFNFFPQFIKFLDLFFLKILIPLSLKRADKIVGVSQFTKDEIIKYYKVNPEKVEWIHNSISEEFAKTIEAQNLAFIREKYHLPENFILYLGTLQPRKNVSHLVAAFARIKDSLGGTKLVICGNIEGHNTDAQIKKNVAKFNLEKDVVFPGFIDEQDKVAVFALAHTFVFPSLYEGFGIPVLEAMSRGVPVLCSNIPSLKEIAETSALFFDLQSLDDFSKKLYDISMDNDLRSELIRLGKQRVGFFSWEKSAHKMLAIYENLRHN